MTTPVHIVGSCPDNDYEHWEPHGSYCYLFQIGSNHRQTWVSAHEKCMEIGAILAPSNHPSINDMIYEEALKRGANSWIWIGLHRNKHGILFLIWCAYLMFLNHIDG